MAVNTEEYAFSFSHATILLADQQFTAIDAIDFSQDVTRSGVFGTSRKVLKRSVGQVELGTGTITFSDVKEAVEFYKSLGATPSRVNFSIDYVLANEAGDTVKYEILGVSLTGISVNHESGGDALQQDFPFDFMDVLLDGVSFAA